MSNTPNTPGPRRTALFTDLASLGKLPTERRREVLLRLGLALAFDAPRSAARWPMQQPPWKKPTLRLRHPQS